MITIKCPICGEEYLPSEIFIPEEFFGNPGEIMKDSGKIDFVLGDDMDLCETYICDNCNTKLSIEAKLSFDVTPYSESFEHVTKVNRQKRLTLSEVGLFDDTDSGTEE